MRKVFIITGEYSGDIHGGQVAKLLKESCPDIEIHGIGGENLKNAGVTLFCDHSKMSAFGFSLKGSECFVVKFKILQGADRYFAAFFTLRKKNIVPV